MTEACVSAPRRAGGERLLISRSTGLEPFHAQDRCDPLLWSLLPMGIWTAALSGSVAVDSVPAAMVLSIIGGVAGSQLFVIGHDACHGRPHQEPPAQCPHRPHGVRAERPQFLPVGVLP
ncbi:MAG: hypothetical protein ACREXK_07530 [Gammaproteobacteria bacterium]